jgi:PAS domain S-box-containing protein
MDDTLRRAALAVSAAEGGEVYDRLAGELADILGVAIGFIAVFADPVRSQMRMLAFRLDGKLRRPFTYTLEGSPCAMVVGKQFRCVASDARQEFPNDDLFVKLGIESYAAFPLNDAAGAPLGLIGAMDRRPLRDVALCEAILKIFAMRAAAELEHGAREEAGQALRASEEQYRAIFNASTEALVLRDAEFRIVDVNPAFEALSGHSRAEVLGSDRLTMRIPEKNLDRHDVHRRVLAGEAVRVESEAIRKDGTRFHIEVSVVPMTYGGRPHALYIGRDITARKSAEEALRASEGRYRAIFNAAADSMVLRDQNFRVVDVNPAYERMSGRPRAEALGRNDLTMSPPELTEHVRGLHARALAGEPVMFEARARRKNGERFDIETRGVPIEHEGRPHVLYIGRDITARKSAEEVLRASEEQYRAIFNAAVDALVLRDANFRIVDVNPAYETMSGYTRDEVIGLDRVVANPPETQQHIRALHERALGGETVIHETVRVSKNGKRRDVELRGVPILYRGKPHVLYIGRDISERKRAEERLRASEEQYRAIFNAAADALILRDSEARIVDVNPAFLEMSGYTRDEVVNADRWIFALPKHAGLAREMFLSVIGGESVQFEVEGQRKDGSRVLVEMRAVPILYRGKPHALGMARDVTERRALESRLRQAQRMEALGHLTGGVAHDFNNLLAAIMGYIVLASERDEAAKDAKLARYLDQALASCRQARDLIQQMLTFSRGQRGSPRPLALADAVAESLKLLRSSLPSSLELVTDLAQVPVVMLDPVQLDQILLNLTINARDAMAGIGRMDVSVRTTKLQGKAVCASCRKRFRGEFVELEVADSGPGIPSKVLERMFEPFFTTKDVGRGSGMGLATVHGIVHEHAGHVIVESTPGAGSRFRVLLPIHGGDAAAPRAERPSGRRKAELSGRVLIVDDEKAVADFMRELLESWGLEATALTNPLGVLERVTRERYDFVILDQTMPGMTGVSLAREIAAARPGLPVVLYTGNSDRINREELNAAGVRALLQKPVEPATLYETLSAHLH